MNSDEASKDKEKEKNMMHIKLGPEGWDLYNAMLEAEGEKPDLILFDARDFFQREGAIEFAKKSRKKSIPVLINFGATHNDYLVMPLENTGYQLLQDMQREGIVSLGATSLSERELIDVVNSTLQKHNDTKNALDEIVDRYYVEPEEPYQSKIPPYPAIVDTLSQYLREDDSIFIAETLGKFNYSLSEFLYVNRANKCKNLVFYLKDKKGRRKVVKFSYDRDQAFTETFTNFHFGRHPELSQVVPLSEMISPIKCTAGGRVAYLAIQDDVTDKADNRLDAMFMSGRKKSVMNYLSSTVRNLARIHIYGTEMMNMLREEMQKNIGFIPTAARVVRDTTLDLMEELKEVDKSLLYGIKEANIEAGITWINGDCWSLNRKGQFFLDWGNAGFGNYLIDLAKILHDPNIYTVVPQTERDGFNRYFLGEYHDELSKVKVKHGLSARKVTSDFMDAEYNTFKLLSYVVLSNAVGASLQRGDDGFEQRLRGHLSEEIQIVMKNLKRSRRGIYIPDDRVIEEYPFARKTETPNAVKYEIVREAV